VRKKAQTIQKQNIAPHMLSHGGYEYLENKLMDEKRKIKLEETTIGWPEHPGCVRAIGASVTIKQYFGPAPRTSHTSSSMAPEDLEQLTQQIRDQLEESITKKWLDS